MQLPPKTTLQGSKYIIQCLMGQGRIGYTYLGKQVLLNRTVVIKELFPHAICQRVQGTNRITLFQPDMSSLFDQQKRQFIIQGRNISQFINSHIVQVYDVFEENGSAYYVMEFIEGQTVKELLEREGRLDETRALRYIRDVSAGLKVMHDRRVSHLGVKPSNIMVRKRDDRAILIDFGLRAENDHPDLYALGFTLYSMVTGNTPPQEEAVRQGFLDTSLVGVSSNISHAIRQSMHENMAERPTSIDAFLSMLSTPVIPTLLPPPNPSGFSSSAAAGNSTPAGGTSNLSAPPPFSNTPPPPPYMGQRSHAYTQEEIMEMYKQFKPSEKNDKQFSIYIICVAIALFLALVLALSVL